MALISPEMLNRLKQQTKTFVDKAIDQQVNLAVTGLSRSGKTAFITSLVNQLINEGQGKPLSFFNVVHEGRFTAAKRVPQTHAHIKRFDYEGSFDAFCQSPPNWPKPTKGISELRLAIRYRPENSLLKYATDRAILHVDITDYPGEWLLDLPMLNQTYEEWSEFMTKLLQAKPRAEKAKPFIEKINELDPFMAASEELLADLANEYTELLHYYREELGLSLLQPGRFILPAELEGTPLLQFLPYTNFKSIDKNSYQDANEHSLIGMLRARFIEYKERVVKAFYKEHFVKFDRQIVLADCLTPLNNGPESFEDLQQSINLILENFDYGKSGLFRRLFSPKIDKVLFAATKADHVTPEQHGHLTSLLKQLVYKSAHKSRFEAIEIENMAIASVQATQFGYSEYQGKKVPVIRGKCKDSEKIIRTFPGAVPARLPNDSYWQQDNSFNFFNFKPLDPVEPHQALPHIRMDKVLQFLLGDKLL